ncbi:SemiSWEET transporter [Hahella sp. CCB-MM4]|uniref:SemiSWEET transporter n=1 Tax=Hahella sp. (strain CCB-MM4) TaxID=1926491 RepID=UPI001AF01B61|nr:SemiSWEET transporter [Hahella sp. CCB-MM4]
MLSTLIGSIAAICTTLAFLPQVLLTLKTRDTTGVSLVMYSVFSFGVSMWLVYGVILVEWPIIIANVITLALAMTVLTLKIRYG